MNIEELLKYLYGNLYITGDKRGENMNTMDVIFYADRNKSIIKKDLFSIHAEQWAKRVCESGVNNRSMKLEKNKMNQIRKFYDEILKYNSALMHGEQYGNIYPYLKMLIAKAKYSEARKLVTSEFTYFIEKCLNNLRENNQKDFEILIDFFEAFMGYYKYYESLYK